jgi:hypothetical protein
MADSKVLKIDKNKIYFSNVNKVYDFKNMTTMPLEAAIEKKAIINVVDAITKTLIEDSLEVVLGLGTETVDVNLFDDSGYYDGPNGYLVEVFHSTSNGLFKMYSKDIHNPVTGDRMLEGFENYFYLDVE